LADVKPLVQLLPPPGVKQELPSSAALHEAGAAASQPAAREVPSFNGSRVQRSLLPSLFMAARDTAVE
jgi:hypothetical protein